MVNTKKREIPTKYPLKSPPTPHPTPPPVPVPENYFQTFKLWWACQPARTSRQLKACAASLSVPESRTCDIDMSILYIIWKYSKIFWKISEIFGNRTCDIAMLMFSKILTTNQYLSRFCMSNILTEWARKYKLVYKHNHTVLRNITDISVENAV